MKARRKSDGEIIEVREWRGASDVVYSSPDMNQFYQASDLDFNTDSEDTVIQGWVARDEDGSLHLFTESPTLEFSNVRKEHWWYSESSVKLDPSLFPDLTWSDEPQECEIIIKRKKNG